MNDFFVNDDIAAAQTLHTDFYTSTAVFEAAKEKIFAPAWQFAGSTELVKYPGDVHPFTLLGGCLDEPLVLTHDSEGAIHCLSNVCTHRGNIVAYQSCSKARHLRCKYHGRLFELSGQLISMPEFKEVIGFPCEADNLQRLEQYRWGKWLFTTLGATLPATYYLQPMLDRLSWLPVEEFVFHPELTKTYYIKANWALYCENYLEGFHIPFVHQGLNAVIDFSSYATELYTAASLQLGFGKEAADCFDLPPGSPDYGSQIAAYYYWVYPNMMFNFYPWGLSVNIVTPLAVSDTKVTFLTYVWKEDRYDKGAGSNLDKVEQEDEEVVQQVQRGIRSRFYQHGRYSVTREQGTHHFHRLLAASFQKDK